MPLSKEKHSRKLTKLLVVLAACLGLSTVAVLPASPALAASCYNSTCEGLDPHATGCDTNVQEPWANWNPPPGSGSWSVQLHYSVNCRTGWARMQIDNYLPTCCASTSVRIDRLVYSPYGYYSGSSYYKTVGAGVEGTYWTAMVTASYNDKIRACYYWAPLMSDYACSPWYTE